jgi:hypothetical protein
MKGLYWYLSVSEIIDTKRGNSTRINLIDVTGRLGIDSISIQVLEKLYCVLFFWVYRCLCIQLK